MQQRIHIKHQREVALLHVWMEGSTHNTAMNGVFNSEISIQSIQSRAILSANAILHPAFRCISTFIDTADDTGALNMYNPLITMCNGIISRLFANRGDQQSMSDSIIATCLKFMETLIRCVTSKGPKNQHGGTKSRAKAAASGGGTSYDYDFCLEDIPAGHPTITRETLETIGEYAFTAFRGILKVGGQVKVDISLLPTPSALTSSTDQLMAILKLAALTFLEVEPNLYQTGDESKDANDEDEENIRKKSKVQLQKRNEEAFNSLERDFELSTKSYCVAINGMAALATHRPVCFKAAVQVITTRVMNPPSSENQESTSSMTKSGVIAIKSQLTATTLTLLRNSLSVTVGGWELLKATLSTEECDMAIQAEKAYGMSKQQAALRTAGRAARNQAALFYEWDASETDRQTKRQRETDNALTQMRAAKVARGLGNGIQLPPNMVDACELILLNLENLPKARPIESTSAVSSRKKRPISLEFLVDAIVSNGASLACDETRWYDRDGGTSWIMKQKASENLNDGAPITYEFGLESKMVHIVEEGSDEDVATKPKKGKDRKLDDRELFHLQCQLASSEAFGRVAVATRTYQIQARSGNKKSKYLRELGNQLTARLSFTLGNVKPPNMGGYRDSFSYAKQCVEESSDKEKPSRISEFIEQNPLVSSCLALDLCSSTSPASFAVSETDLSGDAGSKFTSSTISALPKHLFYEAFVQALSQPSSIDDESFNLHPFKETLDIYMATVAKTCADANEKPKDLDLKRRANIATAALPSQLGVMPSLTMSTASQISMLCDIENTTKAAAEAQRKGPRNDAATTAAAHEMKDAAEKRATTALLVLRDIAFQRSKASEDNDHPNPRRDAVQCAVAIAAGRLPASASIQDKALKLVGNVLYSRSPFLADIVVAAAMDELERATKYAIEHNDPNWATNAIAKVDPLAATNDEEFKVLEHVTKPVVLFMALCVRRPEMIEALLSNACHEGATTLKKAVKSNMPKLAKALAMKYGASSIALKFANALPSSANTLLLSFLDSLTTDASLTVDDTFVETCLEIQSLKADADGLKDPRFIIPVSCVMKREDLIVHLPDFVRASDQVFQAALSRMSERVGRQALSYRDEKSIPSSDIRGMTLCEELVCLHWLDFTAAGLPQKRYLDSIKQCLDNEDVFSDRILLSALDHISHEFVQNGEKGLPLAFMRTTILTCDKHETLHPWICHTLLPRLVEGKIYNDRRQWEGWMRCAKKLERAGAGGASSAAAIQSLPEDQLKLYRSKYPA